jgi:GNAT superfamily N-acetyltransferase
MRTSDARAATVTDPGGDAQLNLAGGRAGCALWWRRPPVLAGHRVGRVGRYRADTAAAGTATLLEACRILTEQGCTLAAGPIDGSTWHRYRLVTSAGSRPPFFLEPDNPSEWPGHFIAAGFRPFAAYVSAITPPLQDLNLGTGRVLAPGMALRRLDPGDDPSEMRRLHELSLACFSQNLLFSPLDLDDFTAMVRPLLPHVREGLSWVAECGGAPVGFALAVPDRLQAERGETVNTVILKTLAVRPEQRGQGVGHALVHRCLSEIRRHGYRNAVFALMRVGNPSARIAARYARPMRGYTLFAKELRAE